MEPDPSKLPKQTFSDGIGAVVKYQARCASVQRTARDFITTPQELFRFAVSNIKNIKSLWYDAEDLAKLKDEQESRQTLAPAIAGIRSHHSFQTNGNTLIGLRTSTSEPSLKVCFGSLDGSGSTNSDNLMVTQVQPGMFVAYEWDSKWYIGSVVDTDEYELEICINTMTPHGPARSLRYPTRRDHSWVPRGSILKVLSPNTTSFERYSIATSLQHEITTGEI